MCRIRCRKKLRIGENAPENGIWTYSLEDIWTGFQDCYRNKNLMS